MKLVKCTPIKGEDGETIYTNAVELVSGDIQTLKLRAQHLCQLMDVEAAPWVGKYPIMGEARIESTNEWVMQLGNGIILAIEK